MKLVHDGFSYREICEILERVHDGVVHDEAFNYRVLFGREFSWVL